VTISTHVLDTAAGRPARGVAVRLERELHGEWRLQADATTNDEGRVPSLAASDNALPAGDYRLVFDIGAYFAARQTESFYRRAVIEFVVRDAAAHYHVPLLLSPFGYTTYRGS
jgi:5-hydroxyisourate hydrolase